MPERLNIPLYHSTARPQRRAVWHIALTLLTLLLLLGIVRFFSIKDPFRGMVPEQAQGVVVLYPNRTQWSTILSAVGSTPLIRGGLTLRDIGPHIHGNLALFFLPDNERVLLFEGRLPDEDAEKLRGAGFSVKEPREGIYAISSTDDLVLKPADMPFRYFSWLLPRAAGEIFLLDEWRSAWVGTIVIEENAVGIVTKGESGDGRFIPSDDVEFFASFREDMISVPPIANTLFAHFTGGQELGDVLTGLLANGGSYLQKSDNQFIYQFKNALPEATLRKLLLTKIALENPSKVRQKLPDGSTFYDLVAIEDSKDIERAENNGWVILQTKNNALIAATSVEESTTFITNSPNLALSLEVNGEVSSAKTTCGINQGFYASVPAITRGLTSGIHEFSTVADIPASNFVYVGLNKRIFYNRIDFCL
ncbi:hypothetical protein HYW18_02645 [Candidatus Uhrbacteria bacterium]|nr:hypothetical protein [Candidatus Uhrbacteria bacterium]